MKKPYGFLFLALLGCKSPSNKIAQAFETVNSSLERSNRYLLLQDSCHLYYLSILKKAEKNEAKVQKADSIYQSIQNFLALTNRTDALMKEKDPSGRQNSIAGSLLVRTPLGDSIRAAVGEISAYCGAALPDPAIKEELTKLLEQPGRIIDSSQWNNVQFAREPTVAAQMTIKFLQMQCTEAAILALRDINAHL